MSRFTLPVAALALLLPARASADPTPSLNAGKILAINVTAGPGIRAGRAMGVVAAPPEVVAGLLNNFVAYKNFMPRVVDSSRLGKDRYRIDVKLPWPVNRTWANIRVTSGKRKGTYIIKWTMETGGLKTYDGAAWIQPWSGGRTLLTYQFRAEPNIPAPRALMDKGMISAVTEIVEAMQSYAPRVASGKVPPGVQVAAAK
jgi:hypothetical protein